MTLEPGALVIEPADTGDGEAILTLQKRAYESEALLYDEWSLPPLTQTIEELRVEIASMLVLKAHQDGWIVGSVRAKEIAGTCAIGRLIVDPDAQGRGIGTRLMHDVEGRFGKARRFELFTGSRSERNIRLYRHLGYQMLETRHLTPVIEIVIMEKRRT